jgi:hypothetical protein
MEPSFYIIPSSIGTVCNFRLIQPLTCIHFITLIFLGQQKVTSRDFHTIYAHSLITQRSTKFFGTAKTDLPWFFHQEIPDVKGCISLVLPTWIALHNVEFILIENLLWLFKFLLDIVVFLVFIFIILVFVVSNVWRMVNGELRTMQVNGTWN